MQLTNRGDGIYSCSFRREGLEAAVEATGCRCPDIFITPDNKLLLNEEDETFNELLAFVRSHHTSSARVRKTVRRLLPVEMESAIAVMDIIELWEQRAKEQKMPM